jgi:hypothetical protein
VSTPSDNALPVNLQPFPARDAAFARELAEAVSAASPAAASGEELGKLVERRLRASYPNAVVRMQEPLARLADPAGTLYAYRDGGIRLEEDVVAHAATNDGEGEPG